MNNVQKGKKGENIAVNYLRLHFFKILERNFKCSTGEIDIIAKKGKCIVFVEVKYREDLTKGLPREAVTPYKQHKIRRTAQAYIAMNHSELNGCDFRFDVIEVTKRKFRKETEHIINAF